eukprot:m.164093 g.164093  ORF g.164093 m.164093 type:complete len:883 (+) comp14394_c0_seq2:164-2812(+)
MMAVQRCCSSPGAVNKDVVACRRHRLKQRHTTAVVVAVSVMATLFSATYCKAIALPNASHEGDIIVNKADRISQVKQYEKLLRRCGTQFFSDNRSKGSDDFSTQDQTPRIAILFPNNHAINNYDADLMNDFISSSLSPHQPSLTARDYNGASQRRIIERTTYFMQNPFQAKHARSLNSRTQGIGCIVAELARDTERLLHASQALTAKEGYGHANRVYQALVGVRKSDSGVQHRDGLHHTLHDQNSSSNDHKSMNDDSEAGHRYIVLASKQANATTCTVCVTKTHMDFIRQVLCTKGEKSHFRFDTASKHTKANYGPDRCGTPDTIAGVSFNEPTYYSDTLRYQPITTRPRARASPFTLQQPQLHGAVYHKHAVVEYLAWYIVRQASLQFDHRITLASNPSTLLPALWCSECWLRFLTEMKQTVLYPPMNQLEALSSTLSSQHEIMIVSNGLFSCQLLKDQSLASLAQAATEAFARHTWPMSHLWTYNSVAFSYQQGPTALYARDTSVFRRCTLVITVYSRADSVMDTLAHYDTNVCLAAIVLVWNAVAVSPPTIPPNLFRTPVSIVTPARNSLNNRFNLAEYTHTDCIINMDDDWLMSPNILFSAVRYWYHSFRSNLVGLAKLGRLHTVETAAFSTARGPGNSGPGAGESSQQDQGSEHAGNEGWSKSSSNLLFSRSSLSSASSAVDFSGSGTLPFHATMDDVLARDRRRTLMYRYATNASMPQSILLPSGMIYHRKYFELYNAPHLKHARELVDLLTNCDDILINFVVANATKSAPIFLDTSTSGHYVGAVPGRSQTGLYKRSLHYVERHFCLDAFTDLFGHMPLRLTTSTLPMQEALDKAPVDASTYKQSMPFMCTSTLLSSKDCSKDCVLCTPKPTRLS